MLNMCIGRLVCRNKNHAFISLQKQKPKCALVDFFCFAKNHNEGECDEKANHVQIIAGYIFKFGGENFGEIIDPRENNPEFAVGERAFFKKNNKKKTGQKRAFIILEDDHLVSTIYSQGSSNRPESSNVGSHKRCREYGSSSQANYEENVQDQESQIQHESSHNMENYEDYYNQRYNNEIGDWDNFINQQQGNQGWQNDQGDSWQQWHSQQEPEM
ncbi:uncharacterized protein LOC113316927 [Papaver somniferum]|uniref:uncharacterized protein LOC113316927 n=1 Tax=Papaver somniferum TaxID=3469 RepID=UPI000E6FC2B7|nr:uncharacterized protein LOC113316927 [Papaver somniferum]